MQQREIQRQQMAAVLQQRKMDEWLQGIRANADIVDRRTEVLQAAEEQAQQPLVNRRGD
jgi:hypothetical protein